MALEDEGLCLPRLETMEGVTGFVQERFHVPVDARGVHEDERPPAIWQESAVAAGLLPLAAVEIEQMFVRHHAEVATEYGIEPVEDRAPARDQCGDIIERLQRRSSFRVHRGIPRTERV